MIKKVLVVIDNMTQVLIFMLRLILNVRQFPYKGMHGLRKNILADCIILGNGPSLTDSLSDGAAFLRDKTVFCMGDFAVSQQYGVIKPEFYLFIDPAHYSANVSAEFKDLQKSTLGALIAKTDWPLKVLTPLQAKKEGVLKKLERENKHIQIVYFKNIETLGFKGFRNFVYKLNIGSPILQNSLIAGIFFALNIGFKTIYVLGADHSWLEDTAVTDHNILCIKKGYHFFDQEEVTLVPNKKDPNGAVFKMH